jgi:hypothetical protein
MKAKAPTIWELESEGEYLSPQSVRAIVVGSLGALYAIALLLIARRMSGALTEELPWPAVAMTATLSFALVSGLRVLWCRSLTELQIAKPRAAWIGWGASLTLVLLAGGVSFPRGDSQDWMIWLPVLAADQWLRWRLFGDQPAAQPVTAKSLALRIDEYQQILRSRDAAGMETVVATLRADFVEGQRNATVYVGFCPPLARVPEITIEPLDGAEAKIVQAFTHGARIDVRLAQVAREAMSLSLSVVAKA